MMNNTLHNVITPEDETFFAAQYFSMNDKVGDDPEADQELQDYKRAYIWRDLQSGYRLLSLKDIQESVLTLESTPEDKIYIKWESPFDKLDEYRDEEEKVSKIISYIRDQLDADFAQQLANRLKFLFEVSQE